MEDARPDESIELELWLKARYAMDEEVHVKVLSNGVHVIVKLLDFTMLAEHLYIFHLSGDHTIERLDDLVFEKVSELVM